MSNARRMLCRVYLVIAVSALVATWRQNLAFMSDTGASLPEGFVQFWSALFANRATISITIDIFLLTLAAVVWMVLEARRLSMRNVWLYVFFGITIAISVTFPLFLYAREHALAARGGSDESDTEPAPSGSDRVGLGLMLVSTLAFAAWCTLR